MLLIGGLLFFNYSNVLGSPSSDKDIMSQKMEENILHSPFKALLHRSDGSKIMAYLYAKDGKSKLAKHYSRIDGESYTTMESIGHFQIYLYDVDRNRFFPGKTPIFKDFNEITLNSEGAKILVLSGDQEGKSDVLLISQFGTAEGDIYEAYGFSQDNLSFKNYIFNNGKKKDNQFYGSILNDDKKKKLVAYTTHQKYEIGGFVILKVNISLSKIPGEIDVQYEDW